MNSFEEIIQFAINHEQEEAAFYEQLATRAESADLKSALLGHAEEERGHQRKLEEIMANHRLPNGKRRYPDPDLKISDYLFTPVAIDDTQARVNYQDALILAAKREATTQRLYQDMAARAADPELAKVFAFLAEQEGKHKSALESEYDENILGEN